MNRHDKYKLLVVDDDNTNLEMLSIFLMKHDFAVFKAKGGVDALRLVKTTRPDLVLLDIMMPDMDGYKVLEEIRKQHTKKALPVIMVSAMMEYEDERKAMKKGANDYIIKPIDFRSLIPRIESQLAFRGVSGRVCDYYATL
ncbi:MAG: response regulator [Oligoflexales bacterium]|nr:response regulator [Oligoflexales bacterium]